MTLLRLQFTIFSLCLPKFNPSFCGWRLIRFKTRKNSLYCALIQLHIFIRPRFSGRYPILRQSRSSQVLRKIMFRNNIFQMLSFRAQVVQSQFISKQCRLKTFFSTYAPTRVFDLTKGRTV